MTAELFAPQEVMVRVYVLEAAALRPTSLSGNVDAYVTVQLGRQKQSSRQTFLRHGGHGDHGTNPKLHHRFEFAASLPGVAAMKVSVMDHNWLLQVRRGAGRGSCMRFILSLLQPPRCD